MPGKTGKRAKKTSPCAGCQQPIKDDYFCRAKDGDYHEKCWWRKFFPDSPHAK